MVNRPGGFDTDDLGVGYRVLVSHDDLDEKIDTLPILSSPLFHSQLRVHIQASSQQGVDLPALRARFDELLRLLHERLHRRLFDAAATAPLEGAPASPPWPPVPLFYAALLASVAGATPQPPGVPFDPSAGTEFVLSMAGDPCGPNGDSQPLPPYKATPGVRWNAIVVECAGCRITRVVVRAHFVDLVARPDLRHALGPGSITRNGCPTCGTGVCSPKFLWLCEGETPSDPLNALATIVRVSEEMLVYCPPFGTPHDSSTERVLEGRFDQLERDLGLHIRPSSNGDAAAAMAVGFAYDAETLTELIARAAQSGGAPVAMWALIVDFARRMQSGQVAPTEIEAYLRETEPQWPSDWPAFANPALLPDHPHLALACNLVMEMCARRGRAPTAIKVAAASEVGRSFLALGELAQADSALTRAEGLAEDLPPETRTNLLTLSLRVARAEVLAKSGSYQAASEVLRSAAYAKLDDRESLAARVSLHQMGAQLAQILFRADRCPEAFERFRDSVAALEALAREAADSSGPRAVILLQLVRHSLSGALANWGSLLYELADHVESPPDLRLMGVVRRLSPRQAAHIAEVVAKCSDAAEAGERLVSMLPRERLHALDSTVPLYVAHFAKPDRGDMNLPDAIRLTARGLLNRALTISEGIAAWKYAGRQALRLAEHSSRGSSEEAALMAKVLDYATRADDSEEIVVARIFHAEQRLSDRDGVRALSHVRDAARASIRLVVSRGHHASEDGITSRLGVLALRCAVEGAAPQESVVVAESLKALALGVSTLRGVEFLAHQASPGIVGRLQQLREARERLRERAERIPSRASTLEEDLERIAAMIDRVRADAYIRDPRYGQWCDATALDVSDVDALRRRLKALGPNTTYVGFLADTVCLWAYALWPGGGLVKQVPWPAISGAMYTKGSGAQSQFRLDPRKLHAWATVLLEPLASRLREIDAQTSIILSVPPPLDQLPFGALPFDGRVLCESVRISRVQGLGVFEGCVRRRAPSLASAFCLGSPARAEEEDLRFAEIEVEGIAKQFRAAGRRAVVVTGSDAHVAALRENAATCDVLHLACHAFPESEDDPFPCLLLSANGADDGNLTTDRILGEVPILPGTFVNLAACASAVHGISNGPAALGPIPAFLMKGAGAVLATLWSISDRQGQKFGREFYTHLLRGLSPAASLAEVQRSCIAGKLGKAMSRPEAWAGYVLYGVG